MTAKASTSYSRGHTATASFKTIRPYAEKASFCATGSESSVSALVAHGKRLRNIPSLGPSNAFCDFGPEKGKTSNPSLGFGVAPSCLKQYSRCLHLKPVLAVSSILSVLLTSYKGVFVGLIQGKIDSNRFIQSPTNISQAISFIHPIVTYLHLSQSSTPTTKMPATTMTFFASAVLRAGDVKSDLLGNRKRSRKNITQRKDTSQLETSKSLDERASTSDLARWNTRSNI